MNRRNMINLLGGGFLTASIGQAIPSTPQKSEFEVFFQNWFIHDYNHGIMKANKDFNSELFALCDEFASGKKHRISEDVKRQTGKTTLLAALSVFLANKSVPVYVIGGYRRQIQYQMRDMFKYANKDKTFPENIYHLISVSDNLCGLKKNSVILADEIIACNQHFLYHLDGLLALRQDISFLSLYTSRGNE